MGLFEATLRYEEEFQKINGNPFYKQDKFIEDIIDGIKVIKINPEFVDISKEERDKYLNKKKEFVAKKIFENFGYKEAYDYWKGIAGLVIPCEGGDRQCHLDCEEFKSEKKISWNCRKYS